MVKNKLKYLYIFTLLLIAVWLILSPLISQATSQCSNYGGTCVDARLCDTNNNTVKTTGTECENIPGGWSVCCIPKSASNAATPSSDAASSSLDLENPLGTTTTIPQLAYKILAFLLKLAVPITAIMIVWAGFLYVTSAGDKAKIESAQKTLIWAIVGLAVVVLAQSVPGIIQDFLNTPAPTGTESIGTDNLGYGPNGEIPHTFVNQGEEPPPPQLNENSLGGEKWNGTTCVWDDNASGDDPQCGQIGIQ